MTARLVSSDSIPVLSVMAYGAKGNGATDDTTAIQNAINACPAGGIVFLPLGVYKITSALVIAAPLTLCGAGVSPVGFGNGGVPTGTPWLTGSVIVQHTAATDILQIALAKPASVNLHDFGLMFDSSIWFANTGHGINTTPSTTFGGGHALGLQLSLWENLQIMGHDGNHYARFIVNAILNTYINIASYGGGVLAIQQDSNYISSGNSVDISSYAAMFCAGTAHAYAFGGAFATGQTGNLNLLRFIRPQVNMVDESGNAAFGNPAKAAISQYLWNVSELQSNEASAVVVDAPDLENDDAVVHPSNFGSVASGNIVIPGGSADVSGALNVVIGGRLTSQVVGVGPGALSAFQGTGVKNTAFGRNALAAATTATHNTAVGDGAAGTNQTGSSLTAFGTQALAVATAGPNSAFGDGSLIALTTGTNNAAFGGLTLKTATTDSDNSAFGFSALQALTGADHVAAFGSQSGYYVTSGADGVFVGYKAGVTATSANATTTAIRQTIVGSQAGLSSSTQSTDIIAIGYKALVSGTGAVAIGSGAQATAAGAIAIGHDSAGTGASSSTQNLAVIGTSLTTLQAQKLKVPGLGAFVSGDKYVVVDASGNFHISALGPAS